MTEQLERILIIANLEIPVTKDSPCYNLFEQRKFMAQQFQEDKYNIYIEYVEHCNELIKKYLGIW